MTQKTDWVKTNCHQLPNPPENVELKVAVGEFEIVCVYWKKYKLPLRNPKKHGRFVDAFGRRLPESNAVERWRLA
jgi:hypothetical protein